MRIGTARARRHELTAEERLPKRRAELVFTVLPREAAQEAVEEVVLPLLPLLKMLSLQLGFPRATEGPRGTRHR